MINMKKICFLLPLLLFLMASLASAKDFSNDDRWYWTYSNNDYSGYIDKQTLKYDPETDTADVFVRWERPDKQITEIYHDKLFYKTGTMITYSFTQYPYDSDSGTTFTNNNATEYTPTPGSGDEKVMATVAQLVDRTGQLQKLSDDKKAQELKNNQTTAQEKSKQEQIEQQQKQDEQKHEAAQKQKENINKGINILGSIFG
ncbi:hypothetical protein [Pectinatus frisingensis]|uniref:hypothetical protein n=1 Tax=Pectinatus frisingensis TaxID=865 RepID=UPI0018C4FD5D|nr:hypothetical protein [Pectinatus frisingensis]